MQASNLQSIDGELICGICLEFFETPLLLPCGHNFCKKCLHGLYDNSFRMTFLGVPPNGFNCPVCQQSVHLQGNGIEDFPVNKAIENIIEIYKLGSNVNIFDQAWNSDLPTQFDSCKEHSKEADKYCDKCDAAICTICLCERHEKHRTCSIRDKALKYQAEVAGSLMRLKEGCIPVQDRINLLEDMIGEIEENEVQVKKQLDHHCSSLMSTVRSQQEELKRVMQNDFAVVKRPLEDQLRKYQGARTAVEELMKKCSQVGRTKQLSLRIQLMRDISKHMNTLSCTLDLPHIADEGPPITELPGRTLKISYVEEAIKRLHWEIPGSPRRRPAMRSVSTETVEIYSKGDNSGLTAKETVTAIVEDVPVETEKLLRVKSQSHISDEDTELVPVFGDDSAHGTVSMAAASGTKFTEEVKASHKNEMPSRQNSSQQSADKSTRRPSGSKNNGSSQNTPKSQLKNPNKVSSLDTVDGDLGSPGRLNVDTLAVSVQNMGLHTESSPAMPSSQSSKPKGRSRSYPPSDTGLSNISRDRKPKGQDQHQAGDRTDVSSNEEGAEGSGSSTSAVDSDRDTRKMALARFVARRKTSSPQKLGKHVHHQTAPDEVTLSGVAMATGGGDAADTMLSDLRASSSTTGMGCLATSDSESNKSETSSIASSGSQGGSAGTFVKQPLSMNFDFFGQDDQSQPVTAQMPGRTILKANRKVKKTTFV